VLARAVADSKKADFVRIMEDGDCDDADLCVFNDAGDSECCTSGEFCIQGVGCRC
jgi:hypothetical protein